MQKVENVESWGSYFKTVDGDLGSIFLNMGLRTERPAAEFGYFCWVSLLMNNPSDNGLSSNEESEILYQIEDNLVLIMKEKLDKLFVGRLTCAGKRDFYFYSKDDKFGWDDLSDFFNMYPSYKFAVGAREEKNWSTYDDFLYPSSPEEYQYILNQQIVGKLSAEGDSLLDPRNVDHWIYFDEKAKADLFQQEIIAEGFSVEKSEIANEESGKVRLVASRIDRVDFPNINDVVQYLIAVAKKFEGQYDGWETKVLK